MASDLEFNEETGDLELDSNGNPTAITGVQELAQSLRTLLTTPIGSFMGLDDFGIDMSFIIGGFDEQMAIDAAHDAIMQDRRVTVIHSITAMPDEDNGVAVFQISLSSTVGEINFGQEVPFDAAN
ncbi:hypothetical protein [Levilactobacillus andaensis]|uniref:hypothetical protein n=1 Tax=Levilactobacillus andaensis TaxID=2799570 RepID=UPI0019418BFE|nr:hypothetical protein [Levilactobacillus andaensis]